MTHDTALIGFDDPEIAALREILGRRAVFHAMPPRVVLRGARLRFEAPERMRYDDVSRVVFHGIFDDDLHFLAALALWGGPCFPDPRAMMDCRQRLPCLVRALPFTRFRGERGFASPGAEFAAAGEFVAKWGDRHCGENKERFSQTWSATEPTLVEPFVAGEAVRVVMIGERVRQVRLTGEGWLKSVHGPGAALMDIDPVLADDTRRIRDGLGLTLLANDYMVGDDGPFLLEVNHIPSVTSHPEIWADYRSEVTAWLEALP